MVAEYFEVSAKSIQRDVEYMRDLLHAPIEYDQKKREGITTKPDWDFLPSTLLERGEAAALIATKDKDKHVADLTDNLRAT